MNNTETFKSSVFVTYSSMTELISQLTEEQQIEMLCKKNSLNLSVLKNMLREKMRGYNNTIIAEKLGVHRVTIQRYVDTLRNLKESEFEMIYTFLLKGENEANN